MAGDERKGSQPYLGPRGAGRCPGDKMIDWVSPPCGGAAAQSNQAARLAYWCARTGRQRLTAARRELAAVVSPSGDDGCVPAQSWQAAVRGHGRGWCMVTGAGSGGGERVVAELGQDVAGLPDDLAGLRQGGALGVLAVGDCGVVAVVGGRSAGVGFPAS